METDENEAEQKSIESRAMKNFSSRWKIEFGKRGWRGAKHEMKCKQCDYVKRKFTTLQIFNQALKAVGSTKSNSTETGIESI